MLLFATACGSSGRQPPATSVEAAPTSRGALSALTAPPSGPSGTISTFAGGGVGDHGPAMAAPLNHVSSLAVDKRGDLFIALQDDCRIRKVEGGIITTVVGTGRCGYSGDGGSATAALIGPSSSIAVDANGNLDIADGQNCRIRQLRPNGDIRTVAGDGNCGIGVDGVAPTATSLSSSLYLAARRNGLLYIADGCRIRVVAGGIIRTIAGSATCAYQGDGGLASAASFYSDVAGIAVDSEGDLYVVEYEFARVRRIDGATHRINTVAGHGVYCDLCSNHEGIARGFSGDGGPATSAVLSYPQGVAVKPDGTLLIADTVNCRVRAVSRDGLIATVAGGGTPPGPTALPGPLRDPACGYAGDHGPATSASLTQVRALAVDAAGQLYIGDTCRVRMVVGGTITTVAGGYCKFGGDGGPAVAATLDRPSRVAVGADNAVYIADGGNCRVREVRAGLITTVPGTEHCLAGGVALDKAGDLFVATSDDCAIREFAPGRPTAIIVGGSCDSSNLTLRDPSDVAVAPNGDLYIAEPQQCRVLRASHGQLAVFAGTGQCSDAGDGGPAAQAALHAPFGVSVDGAGNLYIADTDGCRVREVARAGTITTVAGNGTCGFGGDGGPASRATLNLPIGLAIDAAGDVFIVDSGNCRVREVRDAVITTVAGSGTCGFSGDGGPARDAELNPVGIAVDDAGNLFVADLFNDRVRVVYGVAAGTPPTPSPIPTARRSMTTP